MPQLDLYTFFYQFFILILFFNFFYFFLINHFLILLKYNFISREIIIFKNIIKIKLIENRIKKFDLFYLQHFKQYFLQYLSIFLIFYFKVINSKK